MKTIKTRSLLTIFCFTLLITQSCSKGSVKDEQLSSFMLGGIYFIHGYGGNNAVLSMMDEAGYTSKTDLVSGYKEIFEFPFRPEEASGSKRVLKSAWDINNKETLLASVEDLKTKESAYKAWDYARIVNNLCIGYSAGYVTKEEVYPILTETLALARAKYKTWEAYYADFNLGRKGWDAEAEDGAIFETLSKTIIKGEQSIFNIIPLN